MRVHVSSRSVHDTTLSDTIADIDVQDLLDHDGITYRRAGSGENLQLRECPFCGNSNWKVYLSTTKKRGLCFSGSCNARFNLFGFVKQSHNLDDRGAARFIYEYASGAGIAVSKPVYVAPVIADGWELPESVPLPTPEGHTHQSLLDRSILLSTQEKFGLRWCSKGHWDYTDNNGEQKRQCFDNRIIIPVTDIDGIVKTFQGRDGTGTAEKRYLFPSVLPGTGRFLYGANLLTGNEDHLVICEGPFDVMATYQAIQGFEDFRKVGVVGSFGLSIGSSDTASNDDQLHRLLALRNKGVKRITFLWDGEKGAFSAALDNGMKLKSAGFDVYVGRLPQDKDPNEVPTGVVRNAITMALKLTQSRMMQWKLCSPYR